MCRTPFGSPLDISRQNAYGMDTSRQDAQDVEMTTGIKK
jgi:hypothetical protein